MSSVGFSRLYALGFGSGCKSMCGIAGIYSVSKAESVRKMLAAMRHRGPDDSGLFSDERCALAQARLSIIDTSSAGHQPMASGDGLIQLVFNGELYNYQAERAALTAKGHRFISSSDTEVVLRLYEEYGEGCFAHLRGIFALAIYDRRKGPGREQLLLARDQFGIKPLLYAQRDGAFVFASELKALLASNMVERRVDTHSLRQLLSLGSVYQPATLVESVLALPPAHIMRVDRGGVSIQRYWSYGLDRVTGLRQLSYPEQVERFAEVLKESVRLQMVADVPVGAFLSGGVDSSLIVALMTRETGGHVKTFSVGFEDGANAIDESHEAADVARFLGTDHTRVLVTADDIVKKLEHFVFGLDQPSVDGLNSYFISQAAAQGVTVSLSGTGGDELFLGYPWFAAVQTEVNRQPKSSLNSLFSRMSRKLPSLNREIRARGFGVDEDIFFREAFGRQYHCFGPKQAFDLLSVVRRAETQCVPFASELAPCDTMHESHTLERASVLCLNSYTQNQLLRDIDACSMTHSLEVRVPFLDVEVANFAFSLPPMSKLAISPRTLNPTASYDESGVKRIVCDAARKYLPEEFFAKRAKRGFSMPYNFWLQGVLANTLKDSLSEESVKKSGLFDPKYVTKVYREYLEGSRPWSHPWLLMIIELWNRRVLNS